MSSIYKWLCIARLKKVLSSHSGQVDFPSKQVTFHFHLPNVQEVRQLVHQLNHQNSKLHVDTRLVQGTQNLRPTCPENKLKFKCFYTCNRNVLFIITRPKNYRIMYLMGGLGPIYRSILNRILVDTRSSIGRYTYQSSIDRCIDRYSYQTMCLAIHQYFTDTLPILQRVYW